MSPTRSSGEVKASAVSAAIDPFRTRLADDARDFTVALLALAKSNTKNSGSFNQPSPQDKAALKALARWRRDAQHALHRVGTVASGAHGRKLAEKWLKALVAALDLQRQALSLVDPNQAANAARSAGERTAEYLRLENSLDKELA
jgi:hypothetical protein